MKIGGSEGNVLGSVPTIKGAFGQTQNQPYPVKSGAVAEGSWGTSQLTNPQDESEKSPSSSALPSGGTHAANQDGDTFEKSSTGCSTCKSRKYQDGSNDMGVSFKSPTKVAPEAAASAVRGHENEHVVREQSKAKRENREVVSQTVTMRTSRCPECGKTYVAGGTTRTVTRDDVEKAYQQGKQSSTPPSEENLDMAV